ncbi:MAG: hypothetical protein JXQ90_24110, partial [Cyclobacteriaceae bacterium]
MRFIGNLRLVTTFLITFFLGSYAYGQSVGIGTESPNSNAVLHLVSPENNQGLLVPRLTTAQRTATTFTSNLSTTDNGLLVFDLELNEFFFWFDQEWKSLSSTVSEALVDSMTANNGYLTTEIGDMDKATYDSGDDGVVDNAEMVNGLTVETSVPAGAVFTDTTLTEAEVDAMVANNGYLTTETGDMDKASYDSGDDGVVDNAEMVNGLTVETSVPVGAVFTDTTLTESEVDAMVANNGYLTAETGDMDKATYDSGDDGVVDNAEMVNGLTVESSVPSGAVFTDTTLTEAEVDAMVANNGYLTTETGDMDKATYDSGDDGVVDNSEMVNGLTVETSVPVGAVFTDTTLTEAEVDAMVANNGYLTAEVQTASDVGVTPASGITSTNVQAALVELKGDIVSAGGGDMLSSSYDLDDDFEVNKAEDANTVNGLTVETAVPAGAVFTDTTLTEAEVDAMVSNNGYLISETGDMAQSIYDTDANSIVDNA